MLLPKTIRQYECTELFRLKLVDKNTVLEPQISMPDVLRPEQTVNVKVSEKQGKEMTYTIAVVDEGLLDLTRFKTPNAWDSFYTREALGVRTWDIYDDVIGAYGGKVNQVFSIGGDADLGGGKAKKANRFKPVVLYFGPFELGKGETKTHKITLAKIYWFCSYHGCSSRCKNQCLRNGRKSDASQKSVNDFGFVAKKNFSFRKSDDSGNAFCNREKHQKCNGSN